MGRRSFSSLAPALALIAAVGTAVACSSSSTSSSGVGTVQDSGAAWAPDGPDTDTWNDWAAGFFATYCIECHSASDPKGLDFGTHSIVTANKDTIRCGVCVSQDAAWSCPASPQAKQFPISDSSGTNPKPSDADRDRVVAWIGLGCP
jgi:hypothetical protein